MVSSSAERVTCNYVYVLIFTCIFQVKGREEKDIVFSKVDEIHLAFIIMNKDRPKLVYNETKMGWLYP